MFEKYKSWLTNKISVGVFSLLGIKSRRAFNNEDAMAISTVYTCIKVLSDTIARLPIKIYQEDSQKGKIFIKDDLYYLLNHQPNHYTSSHNFFSVLETHRDFYGNAYAYIQRDSHYFKPISFSLIHPDRVLDIALVDNILLYKIYDENGFVRAINANDILHFKGIVKDDYKALSQIDVLRLNLSTNWQGLNTIDSFYRNNITTPRAIQSTVSNGSTQKMSEQIKELEDKMSGSFDAGHILRLPPNTEIKDLTMNFADAQIISTLKHNKGEIAALYGVPPSYVGIYDAAKFNSVESMINEFKATTLSAIINIYINELESKLLSKEEILSGKGFEFDLNVLNETDFTAKINGYKALSTMGAMTPNEIRIKEGLSPFEGGDAHFMPMNYMSLEKYFKGEVNQGATNTQIQDSLTNPKNEDI